MDDLDLLIDLHLAAERQGPGSREATLKAIALSGLESGRDLNIADIGCGTGASTLVLAEKLDTCVTAVDFLPAFLTRLEELAAAEELIGRVKILEASMDDLPFAEDSLDAIWSEGAIYNMGFENGVREWCQFLKPGGIFAVSELTWLTRERPSELEQHWLREYPEVATASEKLAILEGNGYSPIGYFPLNKQCWLDNYYLPMQDRFEQFLSRNNYSESARAIVAAERSEISLYDRFSSFFGYGYYVAKKVSD